MKDKITALFRKLQPVLTIHWEKLFWLFIVILLFLTSVVALGVHTFEHKVIVENKISSSHRDFEDEMRQALQMTELAARDGNITNAIINNDASSSAADLNILAQKYDLSTMVAANNQGVVLARVPSSRSGDLVFLTTPWGQSAAQGKKIVLVGQGRNYPLIINAAIPIVQNGSVQGALFGGYILNDTYAATFKSHYLNANDEVAFYSVKTGIYGTSFQDVATAQLFKLLFNEGSDAIQKPDPGLIAGHFKIGDTIFHVGNVKFIGSDGQIVGGMFILTPAHTGIPPLVGALFGMAVVLLLTLHVWKGHRHKRYYILAPILAFLFVALSTFVAIKNIAGLLYDVTPPVQTIYNSTMEFSPQSDIFSGLGEQKIGIQISTGGEAINATQVSMQFDPQQLRIVDIVMDNSFCEQQFVIEKTIDNKNGKVVIACGKLGGFFADTATVAELLIQPLRTGEAGLTFDSDTQILAHDGLGTNVLRTMTDGSYQFIDPHTSSSDGSAIIFSYSHPNPTRWYNNRAIHISWILPAGYADAAYELDQKLDYAPDVTTRTRETGKDFVVQKDGIYYFHIVPLKSGQVGPVSHIKLMIDTTPPAPPSIGISETEIHPGEVVRLMFSDHGDHGSSLQKNFYVQFDGGTWLPTLPQLDIPFLEAGTHKVSLRVFDNAGNYSDTSTEIIVR